MKFKFLVLALILCTCTSSKVLAYSFNTYMTGEVIATSSKHGNRTLQLKVIEHRDQGEKEAFPIGTIFELLVMDSQDAGLFANPKTETVINKVILPDNSRQPAPVERMVLKQLSSIKANLVPFYRTGKLLMEDSDERSIREGSIFTIKKARDGKKKVIAVLES